MTVAAPFELLDLADGQSLTVTVRSAERAEIPFSGGVSPAPRIMPVLRLFVDRADKPAGMPYVDVTSRTLQAQLEPTLTVPGFLPRRFTFTARGVAPAKRYEVISGPVQEGSPV